MFINKYINTIECYKKIQSIYKEVSQKKKKKLFIKRKKKKKVIQQQKKSCLKN